MEKCKYWFLLSGKKYRFNSILDLLKFKPLTPIDRIRFGFMVLYGKYRGSRKEISVKDWVEKVGGKRIYHRIINPLVVSYFGSSKNISSLYLTSRWRSESSVINKLGYINLYYFLKKIEKILVKRNVVIYTNKEIVKIVRKNNKYILFSSDNSIFKVDYLISTIPPPVLNNIFHNDVLKSHLNNICYRSCISLIINTYEKSSEYYWIINLERKYNLITVFEYSNLCKNIDGGLIYGVKYVDKNSKLYNSSNSTLKKIFLKEIYNLMENMEYNKIIDFRIIKIHYATPIYFTNYKNPPIKTKLKNLYLAGVYRKFPQIRSMGPALESGYEAACLVTKKLEKNTL